MGYDGEGEIGLGIFSITLYGEDGVFLYGKNIVVQRVYLDTSGFLRRNFCLFLKTIGRELYCFCVFCVFFCECWND